jgi:protein tyrosine kinase modulator
MTPLVTARDRLDRVFTIAGRATRFWPAASVVVLVGTLAAIVFTFTRQRVYKSETLMLYREGVSDAPLEAGDPARKLALKLKEMVLSRTRLQQIIDEHHLYAEIVADRGYVDAVDEMRDHIAFRVKDGDSFGLSFEGDEPGRVQAVTARLAVALIDENSKNREKQVEAQKGLLDAEQKRDQDELREREAALAGFLSKHPEFVREAQKTPSKPRGGADPTLMALEREAARIQERLGTPPPKREKSSSTDPKLQAARVTAEAELAQAQRDLSEKLSQFTDQHPDVKAARVAVKGAEAKLKRIQDAISGQVAVQEKTAEDDEGVIDRSTLQSQLQKVNQEIAAYKNKRHREEAGAEEHQNDTAASIVALETEWSQLSRDVQEARTRLSQLNDKQFKSAGAHSALIEIVDPAYKPTHPSKPSRSLLLLIGLLLSIGLGMAAAVTLALYDDRLYDRVDVERLRLAPLLSVVLREREVRRG